ncbi:hypothetical protein AKJ09_06290 [Labilithrix luteola]|uniref:Uncharacterized protein n=1 Tax=Labilithrix luteola TaxID=1391654 RepID=A0A0K1Q1U4_9BACT|nr:hypothetical protein [Labilithrix luteola]AKU99626.1 hypothetical protein AKJ09_06290 [Labilithrix luteola]
MVAASLACASVAYAGFYPTFDGGELRLLLGISTALLAPVVIHVAMNSPRRKFAVIRTLTLATALGAASTLVPATILLSNSHGGEVLGVVCTLGVLAGLPTGFAYAIPLAFLVYLTYPLVQAKTYDAADRVTMRAGTWTAAGGAFALVVSTWLMKSMTERSHDVLPPWVALATVAAGVVATVVGDVRLRRRAAWVARVRQGLEPEYRSRPVEARDPVDQLPCLSAGATVIEWRPGSGDGAYRSAAVGTALAVIED